MCKKRCMVKLHTNTHTRVHHLSHLLTIRSTVTKHVSVKILPVLNSVVMRAAQRPRASRRTGGKLIMWKMRAWKASVRVGIGADEGCPPRAHRSWPYWEHDQLRDPTLCMPTQPPCAPSIPTTVLSTQCFSHHPLNGNMLRHQLFLTLIKQIQKKIPHQAMMLILYKEGV